MQRLFFRFIATLRSNLAVSGRLLCWLVLAKSERQQLGSIRLGKIASQEVAGSREPSFEDSGQVILWVLLVQDEVAKGIDMPGQPQCFSDLDILLSSGKV